MSIKLIKILLFFIYFKSMFRKSIVKGKHGLIYENYICRAC